MVPRACLNLLRTFRAQMSVRSSGDDHLLGETRDGNRRTKCLFQNLERAMFVALFVLYLHRAFPLGEQCINPIVPNSVELRLWKVYPCLGISFQVKADKVLRRKLFRGA